jgi:hypothetical protein
MQRIREYYSGPAEANKRVKLSGWEDISPDLDMLVRVMYPDLHKITPRVEEAIKRLSAIVAEYELTLSDCNHAPLLEYIHDYLRHRERGVEVQFTFKYLIPECFIEQNMLTWFDPATLVYPLVMESLPALPPKYARFDGPFVYQDYVNTYYDVTTIHVHDQDHTYDNAMDKIPVYNENWYFNSSPSERLTRLHVHHTEDLDRVIARGLQDALFQHGKRAFPLPLPLGLYATDDRFAIFIAAVEAILSVTIDEATRKRWLSDIRSGARTLRAGDRYSDLPLLTMFSPHLGDDFFPIVIGENPPDYDYLSVAGSWSTPVYEPLTHVPRDVRPKILIGLTGPVSDEGVFQWNSVLEYNPNANVTAAKAIAGTAIGLVWVHIQLASRCRQLAVTIPNLNPKTTMMCRINGIHHIVGIIVPNGFLNTRELVPTTWNQILAKLNNFNLTNTFGNTKWYSCGNTRLAYIEGYLHQLMATSGGILQFK